MALTRRSMLAVAVLLAVTVGLPGLVDAQGVALEVASIDDYIRAVETPNVEHLVFTNHIDFSTYNFQVPADVYERFARGLKTAQGNCTFPPSIVGVRHPWKHGQCVITQAGSVEKVFSNATFWMSNLYYRKVSGEAEIVVGGVAGDYPHLSADTNSTLFLTDVTLQGDTATENEGASQSALAGYGVLVGEGSRVHAAGCAFVGLQAVGGAGVLARTNATMSFFNSTFLDNHAIGSVNIPSSDPALPPFNVTGSGGAIYGLGLAIRLRLEQCTFEGNTAEDERTADVAIEGLPGRLSYVYSDGPSRPVYGVETNYTTFTLPLSDAAAAGFLTAQDEWLLSARADRDAAVAAMQAAKAAPLPTPPVPEPVPEPPRSSSDMAIVGGLVGVAASVLLGAVAYLLLHLHRARGGKSPEMPIPEPPVDSDWGNTGAAFRGKHSMGGYSDAAFKTSTRGGLSSGGTITLVDNVTLDLASRLTPTADTGSEHEQALLDMLEHLAATSTPFLGAYQVLGITDCRCGGQGAVQFVRNMYSHQQHAVKFFFNRASFQREADLFARPELRRMMPAVVRVEANSDGSIHAPPPSDYVFPPFIILERGQALDEWAAPQRPDAALSIGVFMHITERLRELHRHNVVHRDLKPGNIIWRPQQTEWTLIDYGCSADIGQQAPVAFTLSYAPPELLREFKAGARSVAADPAADIYAVGVIAWELFTGVPCAFAAGTPADDIIAQVLGEQPAPWEEGHPDYAARQAALQNVGRVKRLVEQCLSRQRAARPTADELYRALAHMFSSATTTAHAGGDSGAVVQL